MLQLQDRYEAVGRMLEAKVGLKCVCCFCYYSGSAWQAPLVLYPQREALDRISVSRKCCFMLSVKVLSSGLQAGEIKAWEKGDLLI